jgi:lactobin A/cerein 7B family class IIb bacteriocin
MTTTLELTDRELSDAELDQVAGGILPVVAGVVVGAAIGAGILAGVVTVVDIYAHSTGKECVFNTLGF